MRYARLFLAPSLGLLVGLAGCHHPSITAVSLDDTCGPECGTFWGVMHHCLKDKEQGIPFYLPKPLLIVAKNFRNVEEAKVGLTDSAPIPGYFDDAAKYADLNARTNFVMPDGGVAQPSNGVAATSPASTFPGLNLAKASEPRVFQGGAPISPNGRVSADNLTPDTFYTYHIVFVPDMTRRYGLRIKGGVGEIRAAMNLVNGWQFTGLGPYYMKDSSTAQDTLASGITANLAASGVANVIKSIASLPKTAAVPGAPASPMGPPALPAGAQEAVTMLTRLDLKPVPLKNFAEISVFEAYISPEGTMEWRPLAGLERMSFDRDVLGVINQTAAPVAVQGSGQGGTTITPPPVLNPVAPTNQGGAVPAGEGVSAPPVAPGQARIVPPPANTVAEEARENALLNKAMGVNPPVNGVVTPPPALAPPAAATGGLFRGRSFAAPATPAAAATTITPGALPVGVVPAAVDLNAAPKTGRLGLNRLSNVLHHKTRPVDASQVVSAPTVVPAQ